MKTKITAGGTRSHEFRDVCVYRRCKTNIAIRYSLYLDALQNEDYELIVFAYIRERFWTVYARMA